MKINRLKLLLVAVVILLPSLVNAQEQNSEALRDFKEELAEPSAEPLADPLLPGSTGSFPIIRVLEDKIAIRTPVGTYSNPITQLRYEPLVDLQERNLAAAQSDITIRGGIFENTGISVGAATLVDPQTGHYSAELPISDLMLAAPKVLTGTENAIYGFNSSVGTINYGWRPINDNITVRAGAGTHNYNVQQGYFARSDVAQTVVGALGFDFDAARSELEGTRAGGQSEFERVAMRAQLLGDRHQSDLFFGYQDKEFSWPNLYALEELHNIVSSSGIESEALQTTFIALNHQQEYNAADTLEVSAHYRKNKDDYEFDKFNPGLFNPFEHETEVYTLGLTGQNKFTEFNLNYHGQLTGEEIESTSLTFGEYNSRTFGKFAIAPEKIIDLCACNGSKLALTTGVNYDYSNRNGDLFSPLAEVAYLFDRGEDDFQKYYFGYARTSQLPGYTAISGSESSGLFRGNSELGRERSSNFEVGYDVRKAYFTLHNAVFYREDSDLTDWTFTSGTTPFASRTANPVDINVWGLETVGTAEVSDALELVLSYGYLSKDESYGAEETDASFYALNFPEHRWTAAVQYLISETLELSVDNEFRIQKANSLRRGEDDAIFTTAQLTWRVPENEALSLNFLVDNLWKTNFEDVPGVPGRGRLFALNLVYQLD